MMRYAREWKPTHIVILGDFLDCHTLSRHDKSPEAPGSAREVSFANSLLDDLDSLGATTKVFLEGNHEARLTKRLAESGMLGLTNWDTLLNLTHRGWSFVDYGDTYTLGNLNFIHDCGYFGKNGTQQTLDFMHCNVVHGHTHRGRVVYQGDGAGKTHVAMCPGWLGDPDAPQLGYEKSVVKKRSWSQGFGVVAMSADGNFVCSVVPVLR